MTTNEKVRNRIGQFVADSPDNRLAAFDDAVMYEPPVVGFADGDDPLFLRYKEVIGEFHRTPREWFSLITPEEPDELSVVCWVLPIAEATRASNREMTTHPSPRWSHTRSDGEQFNDLLRDYVVRFLSEMGYRAIAPVRFQEFSWEESETVGIASRWSERHALYAAGLGTFGLSDGFITSVGKAMRCGSVITDLPLEPTTRHAKDHTANCLFMSRGLCGKCMDRCPAKAITPQGHDKQRCQGYQQERITPVDSGVTSPGCGLCQTGVPCESQIPGSHR